MTAIVAAKPAACTSVSTESRLAWGAAVVASLALHTALLAAALADPTPQTPPEPLVVELIGGGGGAPGGSGSAPGSASGSASGTADGTPGPQGAATGRSVAPAEAEPAPAEVKPAPAEAEAAPATTSLPLRQPQPRPRANTIRNSPPMTDTKRQPQRHEHQTPQSTAKAVSQDAATQDSMTRDTTSPRLTQNAASDAVTDVGRNTASSSGTAHSSGPVGAGGGGESGSSGQGGSSGSGPSRGPGFAFGSAGNPIPSYPPAARRRGIEGTVLLLAQISADGRALAVEITRSSGSSLLDEAARKTIARWHFHPALRNGAAVAGSVTIPVQFSLRNG